MNKSFLSFRYLFSQIFKRSWLFILPLLLSFCLFHPYGAYAAQPSVFTKIQDKLNQVSKETYAVDKGEDFSTNNRLLEKISQIITFALSFIGVIFLLLSIYGGFLYLTAAGNEDKAKKGLDIIKTGVIGLIIIVSAYAISILAVSKLATGTLK